MLRHAWLNLWDKHMTTGRINQVSSLQAFATSAKAFSSNTFQKNPNGFHPNAWLCTTPSFDHTAKSSPLMLADQYISFSCHHWQPILSQATIHTDSMHWANFSAPLLAQGAEKPPYTLTACIGQTSQGPCWHRVRKSHQKWHHVLSSLLSNPVGTGCGKATYTNTFGSQASYPYFWARKPIPTKRKKKEKNFPTRKKIGKHFSNKPKRDRKYIFM